MCSQTLLLLGSFRSVSAHTWDSQARLSNAQDRSETLASRAAHLRATRCKLIMGATVDAAHYRIYGQTLCLKEDQISEAAEGRGVFCGGI